MKNRAHFRLKTGLAIAGAALVAVLLASCGGPTLADGLYAQIATSKGDIMVSLDYQQAPLTVTNFVGLAVGTIASNKNKKPFYDGLTFHRVVKGFVIQGGDPTGTGTGGPGYAIPDEIVPGLTHDAPGVVAMANSGPNTNGSQFYITMEPAPWLDGHYSIFGRVVSGMEVVNSIVQGDTIKQVKIIAVGAGAKAFKVDQASFDALLAAAKAKLQQQAEQKAAADLALIKQKWPKATLLPDGLRYEIVKRGVGTRTPKAGSEVTVKYSATFLDGSSFETNHDPAQPFTFKIGDVIPAWNEALVTMKKGETRLLIVPPELAYGERGYPGVIPPNSYLVFQIELVDFK